MLGVVTYIYSMYENKERLNTFFVYIVKRFIRVWSKKIAFIYFYYYKNISKVIIIIVGKTVISF